MPNRLIDGLRRSADELMRLLGSEQNEGLTDPDSVPEPPDEPSPGRAICGCWVNIA